eukprot:15355729-Ditylum_brightwellii.AAC.1
MDPYLAAYSTNASAGAGYAGADTAITPSTTISKPGRVITTIKSVNNEDYDSRGPSSSSSRSQKKKKSKSLYRYGKIFQKSKRRNEVNKSLSEGVPPLE